MRLLGRKEQNLDCSYRLKPVTMLKFQTQLKLLIDFKLLFYYRSALAKKTKSISSVSHRQFLSRCDPKSNFFKGFQSNKAAGYDKFPMSMIKRTIDIIT